MPVAISPEETKEFAENLAKEVLKKGLQKEAVVFGLIGELGSGKTTFVQGFAQGLDIQEKITSPTYVIQKRFSLSSGGSSFKNFYHIDAYRLENGEDLLALGFKDILAQKQNIIIVEWADRVKKILPKSAKFLHFRIVGENEREIIW